MVQKTRKEQVIGDAHNTDLRIFQFRINAREIVERFVAGFFHQFINLVEHNDLDTANCFDKIFSLCIYLIGWPPGHRNGRAGPVR